jgi:hypothetical protein
MNETEAIIERVRRVNSEYQHLEIAVDESLLHIKPGQSLLARLEDDHSGWQPYLREHWWPVDMINNHLVVERPASQRYAPGQIVSVMGLIGEPYRFRRTLRNVLLLAYDTAPTPLLLTIPWLLANQISVTMVLLGTARDYATIHLNPEVEIVRGGDGVEWDDQVMTIGWADQVFVVVDEGDEINHFNTVITRFSELRADIPKNYLFGVFRPPMPCGAGACFACVLRMQKESQLVCVDGPAFDLIQVVTR